MRHIEGDGESEDEDEAYDNFDMDYNFGLNLCDSGISSTRQQHPYASSQHLGLNLEHHDGATCCNGIKDFEYRLEHDTDVELDSDFDIDEETAHINRVMGYKHYPEVLIDDPDAGFPLLHEIGETIDELQLIMHAHLLKYSLSL